MDLLNTVTAKVVLGIVALAVVAGGISWWQLDPTGREAILTNLGRFLGWMGIVLTLPWATFFVIGWVARKESNPAGAMLVLTYTLVELGLLVWLFHPSLTSPTAWTCATAAGLIAGVYNLFTCDWLAEKVV